MKNEIPFIKQNNVKGREDWEDADWLKEFKEFLMGTSPNEISIARGHHPKLSHKKAMTIIWYLQEHLSILPDTYEECANCGRIFNSEREGIYWETKGKHWCGSCDYLVPYNYDRGKR